LSVASENRAVTICCSACASAALTLSRNSRLSAIHRCSVDTPTPTEPATHVREFPARMPSMMRWALVSSNLVGRPVAGISRFPSSAVLRLSRGPDDNRARMRAGLLGRVRRRPRLRASTSNKRWGVGRRAIRSAGHGQWGRRSPRWSERCGPRGAPPRQRGRLDMCGGRVRRDHSTFGLRPVLRVRLRLRRGARRKRLLVRPLLRRATPGDQQERLAAIHGGLCQVASPPLQLHEPAPSLRRR
jgi:hypothetical protein